MRFRLLGAAGAALAAAAVMAAVAPGAQAATADRTPSHLPHWGGYYAISPHHWTVEAVQVSFKVPAMDCKHSLGHPYYQTAWWAGVGGMGRDDSGHVVVQNARTWLEQAGVFAQCNSKTDSNPQYAPFWELVPQFDKSHSHMETYFADQGGQGAHRVKAGDQVDVTIYAPDLWSWTQDGAPGYWTFIVHTPEQNYVELHKLPGGSNPGQTAEVISEWTDGSFKGQTTGIAGFAPVNYFGANYLYLGADGKSDVPGSVAQHRLSMQPNRPVGPVTIRTGVAHYTAWPNVYTKFTTTYTGHW